MRSPWLEEAHEALDRVERQLSAAPTLGQREAALVRLRQTAALAGAAPEIADRLRELARRLESVDAAEFGPRWEQLRRGAYGPAEYAADLRALPPYAWDPFTARLFDVHRLPARETDRSALMVDYVATSVHSVFEIVPDLGPDDVLYDIGSGLGLVVLLLAFLTPAQIRGVEIEPAFQRVAAARAQAFGLTRAVSILGAAEDQDYAEATALYLYYPVRGELMNRVMAKVEADTAGRPLKVYSTGKASQALAELGWLELVQVRPSQMAVFRRR